MSRWLIALLFAFGSVTFLTGCPADDDAKKDVKEAVEDGKEAVKDGAEAVKDGAEEVTE